MTDFVLVILELSDGTSREMYLTSNSYHLANTTRATDEYPESDLNYFLHYILSSLDYQYDLDEKQIQHMAYVLPDILLGKWLRGFLPQDFLDQKIAYGTYVKRIAHIETSERYDVSNPDDPMYSYVPDLTSWMWIVHKATSGIR